METSLDYETQCAEESNVTRNINVKEIEKVGKPVVDSTQLQMMKELQEQIARQQELFETKVRELEDDKKKLKEEIKKEKEEIENLKMVNQFGFNNNMQNPYFTNGQVNQNPYGFYPNINQFQQGFMSNPVNVGLTYNPFAQQDMNYIAGNQKVIPTEDKLNQGVQEVVKPLDIDITYEVNQDVKPVLEELQKVDVRTSLDIVEDNTEVVEKTSDENLNEVETESTQENTVTSTSSEVEVVNGLTDNEDKITNKKEEESKKAHEELEKDKEKNNDLDMDILFDMMSLNNLK